MSLTANEQLRQKENIRESLSGYFEENYVGEKKAKKLTVDGKTKSAIVDIILRVNPNTVEGKENIAKNLKEVLKGESIEGVEELVNRLKILSEESTGIFAQNDGINKEKTTGFFYIPAGPGTKYNKDEGNKMTSETVAKIVIDETEKIYKNKLHPEAASSVAHAKKEGAKKGGGQHPEVTLAKQHEETKPRVEHPHGGPGRGFRKR